MPELPQGLGWREVVAAFGRDGFAEKRTGKGHMILAKPGHRFHLSVPMHPEVKRGTLKSLIRDAGMTVDQFVEFLE